ncbi:MAG: transcriptional regulator [Candidatus Zixiibacteriota bacterium]|nr:MAG: transcriptional regulator [candidate division Zixibacteria bacterium]
MKIENPELYELHADFCKVISSPKRLMIVTLLNGNELSVGELAEALDMPFSNISQHLRVLRAKHIVRTRKDGQTVYYSLTDNRLPQVCADIRKILLEGMRDRFKKTQKMSQGK